MTILDFVLISIFYYIFFGNILAFSYLRLKSIPRSQKTVKFYILMMFFWVFVFLFAEEIDRFNRDCD